MSQKNVVNEAKSSKLQNAILFTYVTSLVLPLTLSVCISCGDNSDDGDSNNDDVIVDLCKQNLEKSIFSKLDNSEYSDFSFYVENSKGESLSYVVGNSSLDDVYQSASSSKWVAAVIIMRQVELLEDLKLVDNPQEHISFWGDGIDPDHDLMNIKLSQLLSFTSGLVEGPDCVIPGEYDSVNYRDCVQNIALANVDWAGKFKPGQAFFYSSTHLQVAGLMAINARFKSGIKSKLDGSAITTWQDLHAEFQYETGLFSNSTYDSPTEDCPRLAGGMKLTGNDYVKFLRSFKNGEILSGEYQQLMLTDHLANAEISYSPALTGIQQDWHYGFGLWLECPNESFNCSSTKYVSSPGAFGIYPFINLESDFFGVISQQKNLSGFRKGFAIFDSVRDDVEKWANCPSS